MHSGTTTVQQILEALAEQAKEVPGIKGAYANNRSKIEPTPAVVFSWFAPIPTTITHGATDLWITNLTGTLYGGPISGKPGVEYDLQQYQDLIHPLVDAISRNPDQYPYGSKASQLYGVDRLQVTSIRPAEFGLVYAGHNYYGAILNIEAKLHRRIPT
jgi:hypothetical protein